jgi:hypothetical protein
MTIETLTENSIIADLQRDATLAAQTIRNHDYSGDLAPDESTSVIVVTATDQGDFKIGSGIRNVRVEVEVRVNTAAQDPSVLDQLCDLINGRLQPSDNLPGLPNGREFIFGNANLLIFGILSGQPTVRTESGFERRRTIARTFIAAQTS